MSFKIESTIEGLRGDLAEAEKHANDLSDALLIVIAAYDASLANDEDIDFEPLFRRGLLGTVRDYTDEYHAVMTPAGSEFVQRVVQASTREAT